MSGVKAVVLSGGVGGAKLALGMTAVMDPEALCIVVNTGDDLDFMGLHVCPDVDTTLYTLGGLSNRELGWGRTDETWSFKRVVGDLGGPTWFSLGDADVALHVWRTQKLRAGESLSAVTAQAARRFGIGAAIIPMSDEPVATRVLTDEGEIAFQDYFVRLRCTPAVRGLRFDGVEQARPAAAVLEALSNAALEAILIAPSNPYLSVDPILAVRGMVEALRTPGVPIVAVTPVLAGAAVKGPTTKIMGELGVEASAVAVARHYGGLIDGFVLDIRDASRASEFDLPVHVCDTLMSTDADKARVAAEALAFARSLPRRPAVRPRP